MTMSKEKTESQFFLDLSKKIKVSAIVLSISLSAAFFLVLGFLLDFSFDRGYPSNENISLIMGIIFGPITIISLIAFFVFYLTNINKLGQLKLVVHKHRNYKNILFSAYSVGLFFILNSTFFSLYNVRQSEFLLSRLLAFLGVSLFVIGIFFQVRIFKDLFDNSVQIQIKNSNKFLKLGNIGILCVLLLDTIIRLILKEINIVIRCNNYFCADYLDVGYFNQIYVLNYIILALFFLFLILFLLGLFKVSKCFKTLSLTKSRKQDELIKLTLKDKITANCNSISRSILISAVLVSLIYYSFIISPIYIMFVIDEVFILLFEYVIIAILATLTSVFFLVKLFLNIKDIYQEDEKTEQMRQLTFLLKSFSLILFFIGVVFDFIAGGLIEFYFFFGNSLTVISILLLLFSFIQDLRIYRLVEEQTKVKVKNLIVNPMVIFLVSLLVYIITSTIARLIIGLKFSTSGHYSYSGEPYRTYQTIYWEYFDIVVIAKIAISIVFLIIFPFVLNSFRKNLLKYIDNKNQTKKTELEIIPERDIKMFYLIFLISSSLSFLLIATSYLVSISTSFYWIEERMYSLIFIGSILILIASISYSKFIVKLNHISVSLNFNEKRRKLSYNFILYSGILFFSSLIFKFVTISFEFEDYIILGILMLCSLSIHLVGYLIFYKELIIVRNVGNKEKITFFAVLSSLPVFLTSFLIRIISDKYDWNALDDDAVWIFILDIILFSTILILFFVGNHKTTTSTLDYLSKKRNQKK